MTRRQAVGSALAFAGMVLVVLNGRFVLRLSPRGDMLALSAALLWMVYSLVIKRIGGKTAALYPLNQPGARDADNAGRVLHCGKQMLIARKACRGSG